MLELSPLSVIGDNSYLSGLVADWSEIDSFVDSPEYFALPGPVRYAVIEARYKKALDIRRAFDHGTELVGLFQ